MPCTNCARIWRLTGFCPDHYNQGNIATCPEPRHIPVTIPRPPPYELPRYVGHTQNIPPSRVPVAVTSPPPRVHERVLRFVSPTSSSPRCTELISECPICLVDFDESVASVNTSCGHKICIGCFTTMLVSNLMTSFTKKTICPLCRTTVVEKAE